MTVPIPSNYKRFNIKIKIKAFYPVNLGIVVFDPYKKHTDYFRRKAHLYNNEIREVNIAMPVSPKLLHLDIYNKSTGDDHGFEVTQFDVEKLPEGDIWATPEHHRYMDFAIDFAQKAGYSKCGFYHSENYEHLIQYMPTIRDQYGFELITPARIHQKMPRVQLSKKLFQRFSLPVRVAILAHEGCHYFMDTRSEKNADYCGLQYYRDYGFPRIEAVYSTTKVFRQSPENLGPAHLKRAIDNINFLYNYTPQKKAS